MKRRYIEVLVGRQPVYNVSKIYEPTTEDQFWVIVQKNGVTMWVDDIVTITFEDVPDDFPESEMETKPGEFRIVEKEASKEGLLDKAINYLKSLFKDIL